MQNASGGHSVALGILILPRISWGLYLASSTGLSAEIDSALSDKSKEQGPLGIHTQESHLTKTIKVNGIELICLGSL